MKAMMMTSVKMMIIIRRGFRLVEPETCESATCDLRPATCDLRPANGDTTLLSGKRLRPNAEQWHDAALMDLNMD